MLCSAEPSNTPSNTPSKFPSKSLHCFELCFVRPHWRRKAPMQISIYIYRTLNIMFCDRITCLFWRTWRTWRSWRTWRTYFVCTMLYSTEHCRLSLQKRSKYNALLDWAFKIAVTSKNNSAKTCETQQIPCFARLSLFVLKNLTDLKNLKDLKKLLRVYHAVFDRTL